jgi:hypothetical protein
MQKIKITPDFPRSITAIPQKQKKEDNEAELETLRNVKLFLTEKLKQNE